MSKGSKEKGPGRRPALTSQAVRAAVSGAAEPPDWQTLRAALDQGPGSIRDLRQLVKGMLRNGELEQDHRGHFAVVGDTPPVEGVLQKGPRGLLLNSVPVAHVKGMRLRQGDRVRARIVDDQALVLEVLDHSDRVLLGELRWQGRYPWVESLSPEYKGRVSLIDMPQFGQDGDVVRVRVVGEERRGLSGMVLDVVEAENVAELAATTLLESHEVPCEFSAAVLAESERLPDEVENRVRGKRRDLRELPLVTIDGETARDFDDAVFAERAGRGWRLVVAIADVAHYVKPESALDVSARERGNSVYLPDRVIPMLPEKLSNGLCSLKPAVPRMTLVCDMRVSAAGRVTGYEFYEALICSSARLTYTQVAAFLEGNGDALGDGISAAVAGSVRALRKVFDVLYAAREKRGALDFDAHECALELQDGAVAAIRPVQRNVAHRLIEEAMIAANVCAALFLEEKGYPGMYRVHPQPEVLKADELKRAFALAGVRLGRKAITPLVLREALTQLEGRADRWIFDMLILRTLTQAVYQPENVGHFGLALESYMHFTSPIRRYADLLVHRAIKAALGEKKAPYSQDQLSQTGAHISMTERRAEAVSWGVDGWLKCDYLRRFVGEVFDGMVLGVTDFGLFVELGGYYVQGLLHVSALGEDYFRFQPETLSLVGERSGKKFSLGDKLPVRLVDVQPALGRLDLELANQIHAKPRASRRGSGKSGSRRGPRR